MNFEMSQDTFIEKKLQLLIFANEFIF